MKQFQKHHIDIVGASLFMIGVSICIAIPVFAMLSIAYDWHGLIKAWFCGLSLVEAWVLWVMLTE